MAVLQTTKLGTADLVSMNETDLHLKRTLLGCFRAETESGFFFQHQCLTESQTDIKFLKADANTDKKQNWSPMADISADY